LAAHKARNELAHADVGLTVGQVSRQAQHDPASVVLLPSGGFSERNFRTLL
jgi:hypothetical protein